MFDRKNGIVTQRLLEGNKSDSALLQGSAMTSESNCVNTCHATRHANQTTFSKKVSFSRLASCASDQSIKAPV